MILGGNTRVACFDFLATTDTDNASKWANITALVYRKDQISDTDAQIIIIVSNTSQKDISPATKAKAYMNLVHLEKQKAFYGRGIPTRQAAATQAIVNDFYNSK